MALIICTECGKEFSEYADACPNCGCPTSVILEKAASDRDYSFYEDDNELPDEYDEVDSFSFDDEQEQSSGSEWDKWERERDQQLKTQKERAKLLDSEHAMKRANLLVGTEVVGDYKEHCSIEAVDVQNATITVRYKHTKIVATHNYPNFFSFGKIAVENEEIKNLILEDIQLIMGEEEYSNAKENLVVGVEEKVKEQLERKKALDPHLQSMPKAAKIRAVVVGCILVLGVLFVIYVFMPHMTEKIMWNEASKHVGEVVTVNGDVAEVTYSYDSNGEPLFIDLGKAYPDKERFSVTIWEEHQDVLEVDPYDAGDFYKGKNISVVGQIYKYDGVCRIDIDDEKQISMSNTALKSSLVFPKYIYYICGAFVIFFIIIIPIMHVRWADYLGDGNAFQKFLHYVLNIVSYPCMIAWIAAAVGIIWLIVHAIF